MLGGRSALLGAAGSGNPYGNWTGNYSDVSLLLRNGTLSTVLTPLPLDESPSPKAITGFGNAQNTTAVVKYGTSSMAFDGSGDYLRSPLNADFDFGTGDFTVECWVNFNALATNQMFMTYMAGVEGPRTSFGLGRLSTGVFRFFIYSGSTLYISTITPSPAVEAGTWYHVAGVRSSGQLRIYVNGVGGTAVTANASPNTEAGRVLDVGAWAGVQFFNGYIDDLRITKGVARYTANFTPPTVELPANITDDPSYNSVSLLLRNGTLKLIPLDESPSPKAITDFGHARNTTAVVKYGTSSMVFDGSGDYFQTESNSALALGSGDFTVEAWVNPANITAGYRGIIGDNVYISAGGFLFYQNGSAIEIWRGPSPGTRIINATSALTAGTFQHVAWTRQSGVNRFFRNGVQIGSNVSDSTNYTATVLSVGSRIGTSFDFNGYIDDLRITKGFARYTKNFLPPPAELPAI